MTAQWSVAMCIVVGACQVASNSSAGEAAASVSVATQEFHLSERSRGAPPPTVPPPSYAVEDRELLDNPQFQGGTSGWQGTSGETAVIPSESRAGGKSLRMSSSFVKKLNAATFSPGHSYRLTFSARLLAPGEASLAVKFRAEGNATFRTFQQRLVAGPLRQYQLEFTAPAYTAAAELAIDVHDSGVLLDSISLRMRAGLAQTEPVPSWAGSFVPDGYGLVFNDEFNGSELNWSKWFTRFIYSSETLDRLNKENERYANNGNHRLAGGVLYLTATRLKLSQPSGVNYESGMLRSDFTLRYGFFEARVKMPGGLGVWPAFWLNSDVSETGHLSWPPEIDIFEFVNNGKEDKVNAIHSSTTDTPGMPTKFLYAHPRFDARFKDYFAPFNFNEGWHTIGAEWTPADVTLYVDGLKIVTTTFQWKYVDGTLAGPAHILLNLAIGDEWAGRHGIDDAAFPQALAVDWVRVYQKSKAAN